ncbi:MAG: tellurite resistance TerB family protein [Candidatus Competibacteraceae bacterium]|jgi:tellurite resistance protein TerB|nr:tellurite resistance TerB family protein [Candidatus Competibacteraceae bacterium]
MALDWLKNRVQEVSANLKNEVNKVRNKSFMEGVVAGCALVAYADGVVKPEEKQKMMGFLRTSEALSVFSTDEVINTFEKFAKNFDFDLAVGEANALQAVGKLKSKESEARLMVRVCCAIGAADGDFDESEKAAVRKVCQELGLSFKDFDL